MLQGSLNITYRARRLMRTCMHARINAGMTQFSLLARLLLFENQLVFLLMLQAVVRL